MASFEVSGTLKVKQNTQVVSEKFSKREFVLTTDTTTQYPQFISFQLTQDKCALLDNYQIGEELKVSFNLRGREWQSPEQGIKYFNSLEAWRIEKASNEAASASQTNYAAPSHASTPNPNAQNIVMPSTGITDDLPF